MAEYTRKEARQWAKANMKGVCGCMLPTLNGSLTAVNERAIRHDVRLEKTLGFWGIPQGPYLVLPILGPSNVRDTVGLAVDTFSGVHSYYATFWVNVVLTTSQLLNFRTLSIDAIRDERASAFDLYVFIRNAYVSNRKVKVLDQDRSEAPAESDEDLYYFDDDE